MMGIFRAMVGLMKARTAGVLALALAAAACRGFNPRSYPAPELLFAASMRQFRAGHFDRALAGFQQVTYDVPGRDTLMPIARFYLAESHFGEQDLFTAAREFRRVADEYPTHQLAPQALLRAGDAYAALWRRPELDPSHGQTAVATYQELQGRFPGSQPAGVAGVRLLEINEQFAAKEYQTGLFYYRRRFYDSGIIYFRNLIATYPNTTLVPAAFVKLVESYRAIGWREEEQETCQTLRQYYAQRADVREACGDGSLRR